MFSFTGMEIDMVSRQIWGLFAAALLGWVPGMATASAALPDPVGLIPVTPTEIVSPSATFALFEHREIRERAAESAPRVANSATRIAKPAANRASHLKLRPLIKPLVTAAELRHALPYGLLDALIAVESGYRPLAISSAGAAGLAQLMPATARGLGVFDRFDIASNIEGGARYLRAQLDEFQSVALALAAYNAGPSAVRRARRIPRNSETPLYVAKVMRAWVELGASSARAS
jgi:soluble lytic murein transglycosylase-like protein